MNAKSLLGVGREHLKLAQLLRCVGAAVYVCEIDGAITYHNAAAAELWGREPATGPDRWCGTQLLFDAAGRPLVLDDYPARMALAHGHAGTTPTQQELVLRRSDGAMRYVLSNPRPLFDADGTLLGAVDTMFDVTDTRRRDAAGLMREELLQRALDASRLALWDLDFDSGRVQLSEGWSEMLGGPRVPTVTTFGTLAALVPEDDHKHTCGAMDSAVARKGAGYSVEHRVLRPDGDMLWVLVEGKVVERDARGRALRAIGTSRDITERKQAEATMRESEAQFRQLVELSADWYWEQDEHFRFTRLSNRGDDHAGVTTAAHIGKTRWELPHVGTSEAAWRRHREQLERREPFRDFEITRPGFDGALRTIAVSGAPKFDATGCFVGYRGVSRDITAQRAAEAAARVLQVQLHEAQKLQAVGTLAGGIAHDFNSIVGAILGNVALARDDIGCGRTGLLPLEQIRKVALRARALAQQILSFSRRQPHVLVNQPLRPLVDEAVTMLRAMLPATAVLRADLGEGALDVRADATQLQQLLMNLCVNASHALGAGEGLIEVTVAEVTLDGSAAPPPAGLPPGRYVRLRVRDNGRGMDAATQARIFEPFFTTKVHGQGTGLGLAIVRNIADAHGGVIGVASTPGQGSTFDVFLPAVDHETGAVASDTFQTSTSFGPAAHVLVVDDDEVMALLMTTLLERARYRVTCIADAREALAAVRGQPGSYDVVVTDLRMREMSGMDLALNLRELRRDLPVVLATGEVGDELREQARSAGVRALLRKENTAEQLALSIARVLATAWELGPSGEPLMFEA